MENPDLLDRLERHRLLGAAPREELAWLVGHGELRHFEPGELLARKGAPLKSLNILFSGRAAHHVDRGAGPRKVMEWREGDVTGLLPYSRLTTPPGNTIVEEPTDALVVDRERFPELIRQCPCVTTILVHVMLDRARVFTSSDLHDEKMISLGKLAAGLAHELNNPASAAARSAKLLIDGLIEADAASRALGAMRLSGPTLAAIERARDVCLAGATARALSPIERADREETIASWLDKHGVDRATAAPLAETPVTLELLDELAAALDTSALSTTLHWIAAGCTTRALASEVEKAATRVHDLVAAVKRFTYMDRHAAPEAVDVAQGLSDTVAVLSNKARTKSIGMTITVEPNLPRVRGFGGELNQVWANLIDNALDAAPASGRVTVTAGRGVGSVIVSVVDDGPGIPADIQERIFDPFFTTKPVGKGTGLGLDIARRLVRRSDGEIEVESRPGRTEFRVTLPVAPDGAGAHASDAGTT